MQNNTLILPSAQSTPTLRTIEQITADIRAHAKLAALSILYLHPVGRSRLANLIALHSTRHLYLPAEKQKLLRQRRLAGIRMRDNRKGSSAFYFCIHYSVLFSDFRSLIF